MNFIKKIIVVLFLVTCLVTCHFVSQKFYGAVNNDSALRQEKNEIFEEKTKATEPRIIPEKIVENQKPQENSKEDVLEKSETKVPFIVQAPFANWKDPVFQNACEEASMIMAMGWVKSTTFFSPQEAHDEIEKLVKFEDKNLGFNTDTDTKDMERIFREYFKHEKVESRENISIQDMKDELEKGSVVLVPTFGRVLGNPNYTSPGPVTHMLVITGHDERKKEFVTNDPGTRKGKDYRYDENVLFDAVWNYPSGPVLPDPPKGDLEKSMLVVSK